MKNLGSAKTILFASILCLTSCATPLIPDKTKTNLKYEIAEYSTISDKQAMVVFTKRAQSATIQQVDLEANKLGRKFYRINNSIHEAQISKFKFKDGVNEEFLIGHLPSGDYVYTKSVNIHSYRKTSNGSSYVQDVQCMHKKAPVFNLKAGNFYYFPLNDRPNPRPTTFQRSEKGKPKKIRPDGEALKYLNDAVSKKIGTNVRFNMVEPTQHVKFEADVGALLGFVGQKTVNCPKGKSLIK